MGFNSVSKVDDPYGSLKRNAVFCCDNETHAPYDSSILKGDNPYRSYRPATATSSATILDKGGFADLFFLYLNPRSVFLKGKKIEDHINYNWFEKS